MIPFPEITTHFEGTLEEGERLLRLAQEIEISPAFLHRVADEVLAAEAQEAFAEAEGIPLTSSTIARKARAEKSPPARRGNRRVTSSLRPLDPVPAARGLFEALTAPSDESSPVALREFAQKSLLFGTKRWVDRYASAHYWGVPRHNLPARLDWLNSGASQDRAEERLRDVMAEHVYGAMQRAGYGHQEIATAFDANAEFAGRY